MIINLDFDGTCVSHEFPKVGNDIGAVPVLKELIDNGHQLILFTMRSGKYLDDALDWFKEHGIALYGIQKCPGQHKWTDSPKSFAHLIIDDTCLGIHLKRDVNISERPFVDWVKVRSELVFKDYIEDVDYINSYGKFFDQYDGS